MRQSLRDFFDSLNASLDPAILSQENNKRISQFLRKYPYGLSHQLYLEVPLTHPTQAADLAFVCSTPAEMHTAALLLKSSPILFADHQPTEQKLLKLSSLVADPDLTQSEFFKTLWFEYDLSIKGQHIPSVFFDVGQLATLTQKYAQLVRILNSLRGSPLSRLEQAFLGLCIKHLPPENFLKWIGLMFSRDTNTTRITTSHLPLNQAQPYLDKLHWKGSAEILERVSRLKDFKTTALSFDISDHVQERLGMELKTTEKNIPLAKQQWTSLIDFLISEGLCVAGLKSPLIQLIHFKYDLMTTHDSPMLYLATINHVKITSDKNKLEAKAYLYLGRVPSKLYTDKWILNAMKSARLASAIH